MGAASLSITLHILQVSQLTLDIYKQVQGDVLVLYVYQLRTDEKGNENVAVEKVSFRKQVPSVA